MHPAQEAAMKFDDSTIVAACPVCIGKPGIDMPARIVLRDQGDQYVVHAQIFDLTDGSKFPAFYNEGHYFPKRGDADPLARAWVKFEERSRRLHGWPRKQDD